MKTDIDWTIGNTPDFNKPGFYFIFLVSREVTVNQWYTTKHGGFWIDPTDGITHYAKIELPGPPKNQ